MAFAQEDYQSAEGHLRRILQSNGANAQVLLDLGVAYKGMGQLDKAMQVYDEVQKLNADLPELYLNRGIIIGLKGDPEKAITMFKTYLARKGGDMSVSADHPVHALIDEQEKAIKNREEEKRLAEEGKKMEEEMKKQEAAAADEEKRQKDEELKKQQSAAKGTSKDGADKTRPAPAPPQNESPVPEPKKVAPPPAAATPAPAKKSGDEPSDGL
jgi:tetratricopeptide (TPR) repeat protein